MLHIIAGARHRFHYERFRDRVNFVLDAPRVEIEDFVSDVRPAYERNGIVIAPLLASAGTNIKILEAMAMAKAIVSTSSGVNGLDLEPGKDVHHRERSGSYGRSDSPVDARLRLCEGAWEPGTSNR